MLPCGYLRALPQLSHSHGLPLSQLPVPFWDPALGPTPRRDVWGVCVCVLLPGSPAPPLLLLSPGEPPPAGVEGQEAPPGDPRALFLAAILTVPPGTEALSRRSPSPAYFAG